MKSIVYILCVLLIAPLCWAEWSPPDNGWPDKRGITWSATGGVALYDEAPWDSYTQGDSVTSGANASAIQSCLNACSPGEYCAMGAGSYNTGSTNISIPAGVELRGAGGLDHTVTITFTGTGTAFNLGSGSGNSGTHISVNTISKGDTTITAIGSITSIAVGDMIALQEEEDNVLVDKDGAGSSCDWCGDEEGHYNQQIVEVTDKTGSVLTINHPSYYTFDNSPTIQEYGMDERSGIRGVYINCTSSTDNKAGTIEFDGAKESWVFDVEINETSGSSIWLEESYAVVIGNSWFHHADDYGSDSGYLVWIFGTNSDHYIYNNVMSQGRYGVNFEGGGAGVVIAYNYIRDVVEGDETGWLHAGIGFHGVHPFMTLMEGNILPTISADNTMGSSSHNMAFRNWVARESLVTWYSITMAKWAIDTEINSLYASFVGNVLGIESISGSYQANSCESDPLLFRWGCNSPGSSTHNDDAFDVGYVHANYDYVDSEVKYLSNSACESSEYPFNCCTDSETGTCPTADTDLPDSLYLSSKPSWWDDQGAGRPWPSIGPDVSGYIVDIPAKDRYEDETYDAGGEPTIIKKIMTFFRRLRG